MEARLLDDALAARLRDVLESRPTTEAELRKLADEGDASERLLQGRLERREQELEALSSDPAASLAEIAARLGEVRHLRAELDELRELLGGLRERARNLRGSWLAHS